ncbi:GNAT family N-acetyltransferase [Paraburkholderia hospita]|jgi:N-acetylglutamate synthase-like GNAT family acetyltransferase|uniref:GNAT family N-acetyltransferase n=1 Tax=Paraburkholderia hospita TaxID=169430 RepID=UPI0009D48982|nr:GNAT family N-acetyltransferase [Paraburkholderia hospita]SKD04471.1 Acetyltransferase (GNAT) family protein [Paraburkholderia hospita]
MDLNFRQAVSSDLEWLFDMYKRTMRVLVSQVIGWDEDSQRAGFAKSVRQGACQIVRYEGKRCGFVHWEVEPDLVWLRMLCIVPDMQHKSIGSQVMAKVMSLSRHLQKPLHLHVFVCNRSAYAWYRKLGFVEIENDGRVCMMMFDSSSPSGMVGQQE